MYLIKTKTRPTKPGNDFFDRKGQYGKTRYNPEGMHVGNDVPCATGTPVRALVAGVVVFAGTYGDLGKLVVVRDRYGRCWGSAHLSRINVKKGQRVRRSTIVGASGMTGNTGGPHVHHFGAENDDWLTQGWGTSPYFNTWPELREAWTREWS
jgi:murein DD-endopeptidase MepM/ murein hydrolase activator NlpD